ncbi:pentapeptide repeat-containing protein [Glycomyces sp. NRRL B-16210]|uniref:pentapeptide repeat-containing protein n=1 Tax=Glycomyces sp. NRRL B-16210 TaxID=1463821 RepID=UPI0004C216A1|nr:pentapeptide repeat-containing protein [Glycomyces sp. NRRL B-16210]
MPLLKAMGRSLRRLVRMTVRAYRWALLRVRGPIVHPWEFLAYRRRRALETPPRKPWRPRPIPTWFLLAAFVLIFAGGLLYYFWQLAEIEALRVPGDSENDLEITKLRLDTIRGTIAIAAGIGGASALILNFRKQQHSEYHTTQERITELRVQAVEQLSSKDPGVRIGGLHNLERLGDQHEDLRQGVLDEVCAYLRRPFVPPRNRAALIDDPEFKVRRLAQEILQRRLKRKLGRREYWTHTRLELRKAFLNDIDFSGCHLYSPDFQGATFAGKSSFEATSFGGETSIARAKFEGLANFHRALIDGSMDISRATFKDYVEFNSTTFQRVAHFNGAIFQHVADFRDTTFQHVADFRDTTFQHVADFRDTTFQRDAVFSGATFQRDAAFRDTTFQESAVFNGVTFQDGAVFSLGTDFSGATFQGRVVFNGATFQRDAAFRDATFQESAVFNGVTFQDGAVFSLGTDFSGATFQHVAHFNGATFQGRVVFNGATFQHGAGFRGATFQHGAAFRDVPSGSDLDIGSAKFLRLPDLSLLPVGWRESKSLRPDGYWRLVYRDPDVPRSGHPSDSEAP